MNRILAIVLATVVVGASAQDKPRNIWAEQYKQKSAAAMAAQFEEPSRPVFRYRAAIASMLALKPGMTAAEIGAGSGFLARELVKLVGPEGRVIATELDDKMVAYMNERAKAEGLANFTAVKGRPDAAGLEPASVDSVVLVNTYSFMDAREPMLASIAEAVRPGGLVVIVDIPEAGSGTERTGVEAEDVIAAASRVGLTLVNESGIVPGHYAIRFRRK
ncbi:MAG TPA: methyltransferase domain-containing protein [Vicinamibacterales bacterium]